MPELARSRSVGKKLRLLLAGVVPVLAALVPLAVQAPAQAAGPSYVALGDSYASGVGTRSYINDGTSCQRSTYAYPYLVAQQKGYTLNFKACSGATTSTVTSSQLSAVVSTTKYVTDLGRRQRRRLLQRDHRVRAAAAGSSDCDGAINTAQSFINNTLPGRLNTLYGSIKSRAPSAVVVVTGYPRLFQGEDCNAGHLVLPVGGDPAQPDRRPAQRQAVRRRLGQGLQVRQPDQPVHRPRGL